MRAAVLLPLMILTACSDGMTDAQKQAKDEADVAYVNQLEAKDPPPEPILPQTIGYPDIERYKLYGASCAFADGDSMGAIVVALDNTAWIKLNGRMTRLAADNGGKKLPMGAWEKYNGKEYSLKLAVGEGTKAASQAMNYRGTLAVYDAYKQLVYSSQGTVQCSG
jgi:hypothetical protein